MLVNNMDNKDILQCIFEQIEDRRDFINLALTCKLAYRASKHVYIFYRVFESNTCCCACDMSRYEFFFDIDDAEEYIVNMKHIERQIYEKTGEEYGFMYQIDKCFAPPWIKNDCDAKVLQLIKRYEPEFYSTDSDESD